MGIRAYSKANISYFNPLAFDSITIMASNPLEMEPHLGFQCQEVGALFTVPHLKHKKNHYKITEHSTLS